VSVPELGASTDDVVAWLLGEGYLSCLDEDGRPLGEQASPLYERAPRDEQHRSFGDSRDATGLPCNVAALEQMRCAWPAILGALRSFEPHRPRTHQRLLRRVLAATSYAKLLALRAPDRAVPREIAALYKVTIGFSELFSALLIDETLDADAPFGTEDELFAWLDVRPFLIGERQVCAGTRAQIRAVWRALREEGEPAPALDWSALWTLPAIDATIELGALAASAAGAARAYVMRGAVGELGSLEPRADHPASMRLFSAESVPRMCETLRLAKEAGAAHPSLLFGADDVPASLRSFIEALPEAATSSAPFAATDALLETHARPVAARLMSSLAREGSPLTVEAFRRACR
jgi:hypothetical protein